MDVVIFCEILSAMGPHSRPFSPRKLLSFAVTHHFVALHFYISAFDNDKNNLKWRENQLPVYCGVDSLIAINSYRFIADCKPAALSLLEIF